MENKLPYVNIKGGLIPTKTPEEQLKQLIKRYNNYEFRAIDSILIRDINCTLDEIKHLISVHNLEPITLKQYDI